MGTVGFGGAWVVCEVSEQWCARACGCGGNPAAKASGVRHAQQVMTLVPMADGCTQQIPCNMGTWRVSD